MQTIDAETAEKAFLRLRAGFILSIASIVLLLISTSLLFVPGFLFFWGFLFIPFLYLYALVNRAAGWKSLGFSGTRNALIGSGPFIIVCSFLLEAYGVIIEGYLLFLAAWAFYTCVENNSLKVLGRKLGISLKPARVFALIGIASAAAGCYFSLSSLSPSSLIFFPSFFTALFASPFLVTSSILSIRELKIKLRHGSSKQSSSSYKPKAIPAN